MFPGNGEQVFADMQGFGIDMQGKVVCIYAPYMRTLSAELDANRFRRCYGARIFVIETYGYRYPKGAGEKLAYGRPQEKAYKEGGYFKEYRTCERYAKWFHAV